MLKSTALAYFKDRDSGKNKVSAIAECLDITDAAVYAWPAIVPLESAQALEILTDGELKVDPRQYPKIHRAHRLVRRRAGLHGAPA